MENTKKTQTNFSNLLEFFNPQNMKPFNMLHGIDNRISTHQI